MSAQSSLHARLIEHPPKNVPQYVAAQVFRTPEGVPLDAIVDLSSEPTKGIHVLVVLVYVFRKNKNGIVAYVR